MTKIIINILKRKWFIWVLLLLPALLFLPQPYLKGLTGPKLWSKELKLTGYIGLNLLIVLLLLNPLAKLFPSFTFVHTFNRHRRAISLALFAYLCLHLSAFLLKTYFKKGFIPLSAFLHPVILPGLFAFLLFIPLSLTSNNWAVQQLGWGRWKCLHRLVYFSEILIFLHLALQRGKPLFWALMLFIPLWGFQLLRIRKKS